MTQQEIMITASMAFLSEPLPAGWWDWTQEELDDFLTSNAWEPLENHSASDLYDLIDCHADSIRNFIVNRELENNQ